MRTFQKPARVRRPGASRIYRKPALRLVAGGKPHRETAADLSSLILYGQA